MRRLKLTYYLLVTLVATIVLSGCSQEELAEKLEMEQPKVEAQLILSVSTSQTNVRATETSSLPGTATENECSKLTLFIINPNGTGIQDYSVTGENLQKKTLFFNVITSQGQKRVLVAANMSDDQIASVKTTIGQNPEQAIENIGNITINKGFLMTGKAVTADNNDIINIEEQKTIKVRANLTRVVAKVLLTCTTQESSTEYVKLAKDNGYIKLSDVHYVLETTNKKFFPFGKSSNEDPNFLMSSTLEEEYNTNFFATSVNVNDGKTAIKYDHNKLIEGDNQYTDGIYCLENTIKIDKPTYSDDLSNAKQVTTYLKVAAKFTPKNIDGKSNLSEKEASEMLTEGTFYTCKKAPEAAKERCYSSLNNGINYLKTKYNLTVISSDFTTHEGGWQYYETFVNSPTDFTEGAGLVRNNYYIINITSFTAPLLDKTIEVNTFIKEWTIKGKTTIDIETGNNN